MTPPRPWSTMPITGAQHDAWMAEERQRVQDETWVMPVICVVCGDLGGREELDWLHTEARHARVLADRSSGGELPR